MGSYLSVWNNTSDVYQVKVGQDEEAVRIVNIVTAVVGAVSAVLATAGMGAGLSAALVANGVVSVFGVSTSALAAITSFASSLAGFTIAADAFSFATSMTIFIANKLQKEQGFVEIKPGKTEWFGKYTLSLWRQACCVRVRPNPSNPGEVLMDEVYMRPIFTGATDGSTLEHNIGYWIQKSGHQNFAKITLSNLTRSPVDYEEAQRLADIYSSTIDWKKMAEEAGLQKMAEDAGLQRMAEDAGLQKMAEDAGLQRIAEDAGLQRIAEDAGLQKMAEDAGPKLQESSDNQASI